MSLLPHPLGLEDEALALRVHDVQRGLLVVKAVGHPEAYIQVYERNQTVAKMSLILSGETEGVSNNGERFTEEGLLWEKAGGTSPAYMCLASFS